ncbi:MAG: ABC transporter ATP-binding protein [Clostridia bacterium]|nr:ABC transporter ATP-binding protein [Clostridia bacterium]
MRPEPKPNGAPPRPKREEPRDGISRPKRLSEVPHYLRLVIGGFFKRLLYITRLVWETGPWILFFLVFMALFNGFMPVLGSLISSRVLNELQAGFGQAVDRALFLASPIFAMLIVLFSYRIVNAVLDRVKSATTRIAGERVVRHIRLKIMHKAKTIDLAAYDSPAFYEKLENANREAGHRPIQTLSSTLGLVSTMIGLISYIVILFRAPGMWWSALVIMAVSIPSAVITFTYRHKNVRYMRWRSKERRQMDYYSGLMVNKDMVKELRLYDLSDTFIDRYDDAFDRYYKGMRRLIIGEGGWHVGFALLSSVVNCVFFAMIAYRVFTGEIMIGDYTLLTGALTSIAGSVSSLISASSTVYEGTLFIDNLMTFMDYEQTIAPRVATPLKVRHGEQHTIVFEHVSFRYPGTERDVLKDINMTLVPGESLVLVGLNGAGKTTLLKLLTRLYDPTEGRILLDGEDLRDYDVQDLYRMFGIIFQDFGKYAESAGENIHFGNIRKQMEETELREAAEASGAAEFIDAFPEGYATPLMRIFEQEGMELSGGQWQKLAISRAFYSDCDVLILDEPTAALDALAEQEIYNQFDRLRQGKTTIFVSHRLSSATVASKIVVLEYGTIIEEGNHRTLMQKQGRYYELFSTQAARYREDV